MIKCIMTEYAIKNWLTSFVWTNCMNTSSEMTVLAGLGPGESPLAAPNLRHFWKNYANKNSIKSLAAAIINLKNNISTINQQDKNSSTMNMIL